MTRIEQILSRARVVLADKNVERWTDEDLLSMLDEGYKDLCQQAKLLTARTEVTLALNSPFFTLPEDCWQLTRASFDGVVLPFVTYAELDCNGSSGQDWQEDTGLPEAIVYDHRNMQEGRVYPTPTSTINTELDSVYGVVTDSTCQLLPSVFGVAVDSITEDEQFGVLVDAQTDSCDEHTYITCHYLQRPVDLTEVTDSLVTPAMFDTALKYYVIGCAFLTDIAEEYQAKGLQQLGFYNREVELASTSASRNHQRAAAGRTEYRSGF